MGKHLLIAFIISSLFCKNEIVAQNSSASIKYTDSERVDWLKKIPENFIASKISGSKDTLSEFEKLIKEKNLSSYSETLFLYGYYYYLRNNDVDAIRFLLRAIETEDVKNNHHLEVEIYLHLANSYQRLFYLEKSIYYYKKLLFIGKDDIDNKLQSRVILNIGNSYYELKDTLSALKYYQDAFHFALKQKDSLNIVTGLLNLSNIYMDMKKYKISQSNIDSALEISKKLNIDYLKGMCYFNYGQLYFLMKDYLKSRQNFNEATILFKGGKLDRILPEIFKFQVLINYELKNKEKLFEFCEKFQNEAHKYYIQEKLLRAIKSINEVLNKMQFNPKAQDLLNINSKLLENVLFKEIAAKKSLTESLTKLAELERNNRELGKENTANRQRLTISYIIIGLIITILAIIAIALLVFIKTKNRIKIQNTLIKKQFEDIKVINEEAKLLVQQMEQQNEEILSQNDQLSRYQDQLEDIIKERTEELSTALIKAEESDSLKTHFLQNISHEIRTPLNAISGFAQLLEIEQERNTEYIEYIIQNVSELLKIVDNIIVFSKLQANQLPVNPRNFSISKLYQTINYESAQICKKYENKPIVLSCKHGLPDDFQIYTDFSFLAKIIIQLIENAFKFTENGEIKLSCVSNNSTSIIFTIQDTGIGIKPEKLPYIFETFRKIEGEKKVFRGTGIGLSLVDKLVKLLDGNLSIKSEFGVGTIIKVEIPIKLVN